MKFFIFMAIVFGVFLLALGRGNGGTDSNLPWSTATATNRGAVTSELAKADVQSEPATIETAADDATLGGNKSEIDQRPDQEATTISAAEVLPRGEDFSRQQLGRFETGQPPIIESSGDRGQNLRQIHSLNRDALNALVRVDTMLNGKSRGDTK